IPADGVVDVDIPTIAVSGGVTLKGQPLPSFGSATLGFAIEGGAPTTVTVSSTRPSYSLQLLPGTYSVTYDKGSCGASSAFPCNSGPIKTKLALPKDSALDVDIPSIAVTGKVTLGGQPLPLFGSATLAFALSGGTDVQLTANSTRATYSVQILPAGYAINY